ncbi:hypothetical protein BROUX41_004041 [Berkeleyomyces rouxiae]|uniref:uncharacterized protein n=1 Tax=Berkeleyomyces rouxiae TaxID=2035830 RepID=UPI003B781E37
MTSSSNAAVGQAMISLLSDPQVIASRALHVHGGKVTLNIEVVDLANVASIDRFTRTIIERHRGEIDFIVNSMGLMLPSYDFNSAEATLNHDVVGSLAISTSFNPYMRPGTGHIILPSHPTDTFKYFPPTCASLFLNSKTSQDVLAIMDAFTSSAQRGVVIDEGWVANSYAMGQAATSVLAHVLTLENESQGNKAMFSAAAMTPIHGMPTTGTPAEAMAQMPVWLVLKGCGGRSGGLWESGIATFR